MRTATLTAYLRYWITIAVLVGLTACASIGSLDQEPEAVLAARQLESKGRFADAARAYWQYANTLEGDARHEAHLMAADAFISANEIKRAREIIGQMPKQKLPANIESWRHLVTTRLHLRDRKPQLALKSLPKIDDHLSRGLRQRIARTRAETFAANQQPLNEAQSWFDYRSTAGASANTDRKLWSALNAIPLEQLRELMPPAPDDFGGWLELAYLHQQHRWRIDDFQREVTQWQQRYPKHAANTRVASLLADAEQLSRMPAQIGVLLPLSGKLAEAGNAIREGMIAAHVQSDRLGAPQFRFYDANNANIDTLLKTTQKDGMQFIIGPLDKAIVDNLAKRASLPLPVLALNYATGAANPPSNLYQFGLLPEDEAVAIAHFLHRQGRRQPALLVPESAWGQRLGKAFKTAWQQLNKNTPREIKYRNDTRDFTATLNSLLAAKPDAIALGAFPAAGRSIQSQLHALKPDMLVVAASQIYTGIADPKQDQDLEGLIVGDGPWLIDPEAAQSDARQQLLKRKPQLITQYGRLVALGIDAYHLVAQLPALRSGQQANYLGATGLLQLDSKNQIHRDLAWAQFRLGVLTPINTPGD